MTHSSSRRWVPKYALYQVEHDDRPAFVVLPGRDDRNDPNRREFRARRGHFTNDVAVVREFVALSAGRTDLTMVVRFVVKHGHLGNIIGILPDLLVERFGDVRANFAESPGKLMAGNGGPDMLFQGDTRLVTVETFQRPATLVGAILTMNRALREHGTVPWASYAKRSDVRSARAVLASFGFGGINVRGEAELERAPLPDPLDDPKLDDFALHLAKYAGADAEAHAGPFVEVAPGRYERAGADHPETQVVVSQIRRWRAYWAATQRLHHGPPVALAVQERFQKRSDSHALENAAQWLVHSADLRAVLEGGPGEFALRYAPTTLWQAVALGVARQLTASDGPALRTCRFCGLPFVPTVNPTGGRPRTLCEECFTPRLAKTVTERYRRARALPT